MKPDRQLRFCALNGRSVNNKNEDVKALILDRKLNLPALTETWHEDSAYTAIKRLRTLGLNVIEAARIIPDDIEVDDVDFVNYGGIAVVSKPGIRVTKMSVKLSVSTFEYVYCRITSDSASSILVVICRPGSKLPTSEVFKEFTKFLELTSTFDLSVTITGNVNVHFQTEDEANTRRKNNNILESFGLIQHVSLPNHEQRTWKLVERRHHFE